MMFSASHALNVDDLPSDIIRIIIKDGLKESFESMRLISPRWNILALDHISHRKRRPAIKSFKWGRDNRLRLNIPKRFRDYFGVASCSYLFLRNFISQFISHKIIQSQRDFDLRIFEDMEISMKRQRILNRINHIFDRSSHIERLEFDIHYANFYLDMDKIRTIVGNVSIKDLIFTGVFMSSSFHDSTILNAVPLFCSRRVILHYYHVDVNNLRTTRFIELITAMINVVPTVEITGVQFFTQPWDAPYWRTQCVRVAVALTKVAKVNVKSRLTDEKEWGADVHFTFTASKLTKKLF